jgi:hypothetical protein
MGIEFVLIMASLLSNEQIRTALYLDRPAAQIQIQQQQYIEMREKNTQKILEAIRKK